nr:SigE family RNA polymerase sigma factor [Micromonospora sp. DSM 115978]
MAARNTLEDEFREFVAARSPSLLRTAYLLVGDWATAEDLLQTALTKTYLAWKRLGRIEAVEPYTRRVLVNTATSWWRRRWHGERPTEVLPERAVPDQIDEQLERDALWKHLRALPARQRAVLVLRYYEDLSEAQTAATLNISTGTVKSQTFRALNTLRKRLGGQGDLLPGPSDGTEPTPASALVHERPPTAPTLTHPEPPPPASASRLSGTPGSPIHMPAGSVPAGSVPATPVPAARPPATSAPAARTPAGSRAADPAAVPASTVPVVAGESR